MSTLPPVHSAMQELSKQGLISIILEARGKKPVQKGWNKQVYPPTCSQIERWAKTYPNANLGLLTGKVNGIVVVDVDDPTKTEAMLRLCGSTPLVIRTQSGGMHLYYKYAGEGSSVHSLAPDVDIRGDNGMVVIPPSAGRSHASQGYQFISGGWDMIRSLPELSTEAKCILHDDAKTENIPVKSLSETVEHESEGLIKEGYRNTYIFKHLLRRAPHINSFEELLSESEAMNDQCQIPLPRNEVKDIAKSVWSYKLRGRLRVKNSFAAVFYELIPEHVMQSLSPYELTLWLQLMRIHGANGKKFSLVSRAMEKSHSTTMNAYKIDNARRGLLEKGYLARTHVGGSRKGDPSLYRLVLPPISPLLY